MTPIEQAKQIIQEFREERDAPIQLSNRFIAHARDSQLVEVAEAMLGALSIIMNDQHDGVTAEIRIDQAEMVFEDLFESVTSPPSDASDIHDKSELSGESEKPSRSEDTSA